MRVLGVDPGGTTGVAIIKLPEMLLEDTYKLDIGEVFDMAFTLVGYVDLVAIERYVITQRTAMLVTATGGDVRHRGVDDGGAPRQRAAATGDGVRRQALVPR